MLIATVKATGKRYAVQYDCREQIDRENHRVTYTGPVRCWGPLLRTKRNGGLVFLKGGARTYPADQVVVEDLPKAQALDVLELAPGSRRR